MLVLTLDFWGIATLGLLAAGLFVLYRLTWRLAYFSEGVVVSLTRAGLYTSARALLQAAIGYTHHTYQQSRFIVWNQVHVRFFLLWGSTFLLTGLLFLFRVPTVVWMPLALAYIGYRLVHLWLNPPKPAIQTTDATLQELIQEVNEPVRGKRKPIARPQWRQWDYLDELFAEPS